MAIQNLPSLLQQQVTQQNTSSSSTTATVEKSGMDLWPAFEKVWAPEEVYFPTALALTGHLPSPTVIMEPVTHSEWDTRARDHKQRAHPKVYDGYPFTLALINDIRYRHQNQGINNDKHCVGNLFMRKWKEPICDKLWAKVILEKRDANHLNNLSQNTHKRNQYNRHESYSNHSNSRKRQRNNGYDYNRRYGDNRHYRDYNYNRNTNYDGRYPRQHRNNGQYDSNR